MKKMNEIYDEFVERMEASDFDGDSLWSFRCPYLTGCLNQARYRGIASKNASGGKLPETEKSMLEEILFLAETTKQNHSKSARDRAKLIVEIQKTKAAFGFSLESFPLDPIIDGTSSGRFRAGVADVVGALPLAAQYFVGRNVRFVELGTRNSVRGVAESPKADYRVITVAAGLEGEKLRYVLAHEIAHTYLRHDYGGKVAETQVDGKLFEWGFERPENL